MNVNDLQFDCLNDDCLRVLSSYAIREAAVRLNNPDGGWLDRINEIPGVDSAALTSVHGILIAQGMLKFEITGRSVGLQYQISSVGREALARFAAGNAETDGEAGAGAAAAEAPSSKTPLRRGAA